MFSIIRDIVLFIAIFSFFNDNFMVDLAGSSILKVIFALFIAINAIDIFKATFRPAPNMVVKSYNIFMIIFSSVTLISVAFFNLVSMMDALMVLVSMHSVFIFVTYYRAFDKLIYFIWASVMFSAFTSLFHEPIAEFTYRITGGTADPVEFSGHLFMGIFATLYLFNKNKNYIFLIGSILLSLYAMLYAGSKTAVLTIAILGLYAIVVRFKHIFRYIFSFKGLVSLFIIAGIFAVQSGMFSKMKAVEGMKERAKTSRTANQRFISWKAGWGMIQDHFFTGVGVNKYADNTPKYLKDSLGEDGYAPHNIFVKIFAETGIFPFLSFLIFLFFLLKTKYYEVIKSDYFWIALIPLSSIFMGLALSITYEKHFWLSLALLANIILTLKHQNTEVQNVQEV